jgi:hypothetical protein
MRSLFPALLGLAAAALSFTSCQDADRIPAPAATSVALVHATIDADADTFNLLRARASIDGLPGLNNPTRPIFRFTLDVPNQRDVRVSKVFVYKTLRRGANASTYTYGPRVLAREVSTFPTVLTFDSQEVLTDLQFIGSAEVTTASGTTVKVRALQNLLASDATLPNNVFLSDAVIFTYEYEVETNGQTQRIILTPTRPATVQAPVARQVDVITGSQIDQPFAVVAPFR